MMDELHGTKETKRGGMSCSHCKIQQVHWWDRTVGSGVGLATSHTWGMVIELNMETRSDALRVRRIGSAIVMLANPTLRRGMCAYSGDWANHNNWHRRCCTTDCPYRQTGHMMQATDWCSLAGRKETYWKELVLP